MNIDNTIENSMVCPIADDDAKEPGDAMYTDRETSERFLRDPDEAYDLERAEEDLRDALIEQEAVQSELERAAGLEIDKEFKRIMDLLKQAC